MAKIIKANEKNNNPSPNLVSLLSLKAPGPIPNGTDPSN